MVVIRSISEKELASRPPTLWEYIITSNWRTIILILFLFSQNFNLLRFPTVAAKILTSDNFSNSNLVATLRALIKQKCLFDS